MRLDYRVIREPLAIALLISCLLTSASLAEVPAIRGLAFCPDGNMLAACSSAGVADGALAVWNTESWDLQFRHQEAAGTPRATFSPDGEVLAVARFASEARLVEAATGKLIAELKGHSNHARCVTYTPDGSKIITGSYDRSIKVWDASTAQLLHSIDDAGEGPIYEVDVSSDGNLLVAADAKQYTIKLFDLTTRELLFTSKPMGSLVPHVRFSPDGATIAASSWGGYSRMFDTASKTKRFDLGTNSAHWTSFSKQGMIAVAGYNSLFVYSFPQAEASDKAKVLELLSDFENDDYHVREAATATLKRLGGVTAPFLEAAQTSKNPEVRIRCRRIHDFLLKGENARELPLDAEPECAEFSPDGRLLATGDKLGNIVIWDVQNWNRLRELKIAR